MICVKDFLHPAESLFYVWVFYDVHGREKFFNGSDQSQRPENTRIWRIIENYNSRTYRDESTRNTIQITKQHIDPGELQYGS